MNRSVLVSDIGGTNSRFAIFANSNDSDGSFTLLDSAWLKTGEADSISDLLQALDKTKLKNHLETIKGVVIAAAGPIQEKRYCYPPNIPWDIDLQDVEKCFSSVECHLINDFLAQAYSCLSPIAAQAKTIKEGSAEKGSIAVLGAGTGLGKAILTNNAEGQYMVGLPSEGGHANYPVESEEEFEFYSFLKNKLSLSYLSFEHVLSGAGLSYMWEFYSKEQISPKDVAERIEKGECPQLINLYRNSFARACRCFALETYSVGGLFIAGGVIAKNPFLIEGEDFIRHFVDSPTQHEFLNRVSIYLIDNEESGLWGAAQFGFDQLGMNE